MELKKLLETLCATLHQLIILFLPVFSISLLAYALYYGSIYRYFATVYLIHLYMNLYIRDCGGYNYTWLLTSYYFKLIRDYFSLKLVPLGKYPSDQNYIIGVHPHGVTSNGLLALVNHTDTNFQQIFGKARIKFATVNFNFALPFTKDYYYSLNAVNASAESFNYWLRSPDGGHILALVVGGTAESNYTVLNEYKIILRKRTGFIQIALSTGSHLIPSFTFGEIEVFPSNKATGVWIKLQCFVKKTFNLGLPIMTTLIPKRVPITVVLGEPIIVQKNPNPTKEEVKALLETYIAAVQTLFDSHKETYYPNKNAQLLIE